MPVRAKEITGGRAGGLDDHAAADEQTRSDHASQRDHLHVPPLQSAPQALKLPGCDLGTGASRATRDCHWRKQARMPLTPFVPARCKMCHPPPDVSSSNDLVTKKLPRPFTNLSLLCS